jgi:light-regulated signal transduction histidine kinase (bacteriophytochrome)
MDKRYLEECEREPLPFSGAIEPHGALIATDGGGRVSHASANIAAFTGLPPDAWLDRPAPSWLREAIDALAQVPGRRLLTQVEAESTGKYLGLVASRTADGQGCIYELTAPLSITISETDSLPPVPGGEEEAQALRQRLIEQVAEHTGAQRVLYYRFHPDGHGEVIAEVRADAAIGSYLGLHFPASDIPRIARELYLKTPWRLIADAQAEPVALLAAAAAKPLDLTWAHLRSVSPVHRVYLANMGVRASLSFPVIIGGQLVALVTAHHDEPLLLPPLLLDALARLVRAHAFAIGSWQAQRRMRLVDGLIYRFKEAQALLARHGDLQSAWPELAAWLTQEFQADGAVLCDDDAVLPHGQTFEEAALAACDDWLVRQHDLVWIGESLSREIPGYPLSEVAGAIALYVPRRGVRGLRLYLTRREQIYEVAWGGNPDKPVEYHDGRFGIAPRRSFAKWIERRLGHCRPWDNESRLLALKLRELLLGERLVRD